MYDVKNQEEEWGAMAERVYVQNTNERENTHTQEKGDTHETYPSTKRDRKFGRRVAVTIVRDAYGPHRQRTEEDYADSDNPLAWQDDALCAQVDPELFFPDSGDSTNGAKQICRDCEVRNICLRYALENGEQFGVWGGLSARERRKLMRGRSRRAAIGQIAING